MIKIICNNQYIQNKMIKNKQKLKINKKMKKMYKTNKMDFAKKLIKIYSL